MSDLFLGIDTSNYRTSAALTDADGKIVYNHRELLDVPMGERGLRQSDAFFRHVQRLPEVIKEVMEYRDDIRMVAVSEKPRPREGSYMPCFTAGTACAEEIASAMGTPVFRTSHQEGHIEAVKFYSELKDENDIIFFHFSGGTTEAVYGDEIVGGTLDIALGQVIDRVGVKLGMAFPSGEIMDRIALNASGSTGYLKPVKVKDGYMNLSGIETQTIRKAEEMMSSGDNTDGLIRELFGRLGDAILDMSVQLKEKYGSKPMIFAGGVASSEYIRNHIRANIGKDIRYAFGKPELSGDNAVGTALLGMKNYYKR